MAATATARSCACHGKGKGVSFRLGRRRRKIGSSPRIPTLLLGWKSCIMRKLTSLKSGLYNVQHGVCQFALAPLPIPHSRIQWFNSVPTGVCQVRRLRLAPSFYFFHAAIIPRLLYEDNFLLCCPSFFAMWAIENFCCKNAFFRGSQLIFGSSNAIIYLVKLGCRLMYLNFPWHNMNYVLFVELVHIVSRHNICTVQQGRMGKPQHSREV